jgi:hypothetical protein
VKFGSDKANIETIAARLEKLIKAHGGIRKVAKAAVIPIKTLYNYIGEEPADVPSSNLAKLCKALNADANDLLGVEGAYVSVPLRRVHIDERGKAKLVDTDRLIHFRSDWLSKQDDRTWEDFRAQIFAFQADHAAMAPIQKGDVILVDGGTTHEQKGAKFLVLIGGGAAIVTLAPRLNSEIRMVGEDGETEDIPRVDFGARVKVSGRVLWRGGAV